MKENIEKAAALDVVKRTSGDYAAAWSEIAHMPTADVVEVVRCKDCIYYRNKECESDDFWSALYGDDIGLHYMPDSDFYCAYGERRKNNESNN